jgi:hypothetical protein
VEDHALDRQPGGRREHLEQVPRDGLPFPVLIGGEIELGRVLQALLELADDLLLLGGHHIEGLEAVVGVDAEARPRLTLVGGRNFGRVPGEVPDVTHGGLHDEVPAEEAGDGPGLRG